MKKLILIIIISLTNNVFCQEKQSIFGKVTSEKNSLKQVEIFLISYNKILRKNLFTSRFGINFLDRRFQTLFAGQQRLQHTRLPHIIIPHNQIKLS